MYMYMCRGQNLQFPTLTDKDNETAARGRYTRISDVDRARLIETFEGNSQEWPKNTFIEKYVSRNKW